MFSKPLYKQSCKANAVVWSLVTFATCFMLAVVILVIGATDAGELRDSLVKVFQDNYVYAQVDKSAMQFYNVTNTGLTAYEKNTENLNTLFEKVTPAGYKKVTGGYRTLLENGKTDEEARAEITSKSAVLGLKREHVDALVDYYLVKGEDLSDTAVSAYAAEKVAQKVYESVAEKYGEERAEEARSLLQGAFAAYQAQSTETAEVFATGYVADMLALQIPEKLKEEGLAYEYKDIYAEAEEAIKDFRGRLTVDPDADAEALISELSTSIIEQFPENVTDALDEIRGLDVFGLIIGSVFFKMAGLLLPIVYTIMTATNLIAGQVDSGSMAYVLSTPTKRTTVVFTQACYLVSSLFCMYLLTTLTGVICLAAIAGSEVVTVTYGEMVLLNLGAFVTIFAISGICFLASAWFNRSKQATTWGGGLSMFFLVAVILGLFGSSVIPTAIRIDAMKYFNYFTIISLFDSLSILGGTLTYLWKFAILFAIGIVCYAVSVVRFNKKDLPL